MNSDRSPFISSRLKSGLYALNKLASAGLTLLLLVILSGMLPLQDQLPLASDTDLPIPLSYWVYGYAMTASILADFVLYVLPPLSRDKQISIYAAAGFCASMRCMYMTPQERTISPPQWRACVRCCCFTSGKSCLCAIRSSR